MTQLEIKFFFPFTEQIPMDLDFTESDRYAEELREETRRKQARESIIYNIGPTTTAISTAMPSLVINGKDTIGYLNVGNTKLGLNSNPKWYQKLLFKIMGFSWSKK
jgi:hypothetical protein